MDQKTYEAHKKTLSEGKVAIHEGRTLVTVEELNDLRAAQDNLPFGGPSAGEVAAIYSGRLSPAQIEELGQTHPLIVAAKRLTAEQIDDLAEYFVSTLTPAAATEAPTEVSETPEKPLTLADDAREQAVQAQAATGTNDALTPKTVLDNKTSEEGPAGKKASKTKADAAQAQEQDGAKDAS